MINYQTQAIPLKAPEGAKYTTHGVSHGLSYSAPSELKYDVNLRYRTLVVRSNH